MTKFEKTVKALKEDIADLEKSFNKATADLDEATKLKAREIVEKTEDTINRSIDKVSAVINDIKDEEKMNDLLDKVKAKAKEATDYAGERIDAIINNNDGIDIDKLHDDIMAEFDKLKETDAFKKTTVLIKEGYDKINEFLDKPEVKQAINKAKTTTISIAEKGVEGLKKVLETKAGTKATKKTTKKKDPAKKTTTKKPVTKKASPKKATKKTTTKKATKKSMK